MAEKAKAGEMMYTVPLRQEALKTSHNRRTNRAVAALRQFVSRHTKAEHVVVSPALNEELWLRGIHRPPPRITVKVTVDGGTATARLPDEAEKKEEPKKSGLKEKISGRRAGRAAAVSGQEGSGRTETAGKTGEKEAGTAEGPEGQKMLSVEKT